MLNLKSLITQQGICKCISKGNSNILPWYGGTMAVKKPGGLSKVQVRCKTTTRPKQFPPGVTPFDPKSIPYVRPGLQPLKGKFLLVIPVIAFGLGTWQTKRLQWKTDLINKINERMSMDPVPLPQDPEEVAELEFQKVYVTGTFDHENEFYYGPKPCFVDGEPATNTVSQSGKGSYGFNLITPFIRSDTGEKILVNRGWIRTAEIQPEKRPWSKTEGEQTIKGLVRTPEPIGMLAPTQDPKYKIWHFRDIITIAKEKECLPIWIDATTEHSIKNHLWGGQTRYQLRNEHMSYILTWYALSIATGYLWWVRYMKK